MSDNDPAHWRGCAEDMRVLAHKMKDAISKRIMHRIAADYERLAQTAEQRRTVFPRISEVVPTSLRLFAFRRSAGSAPSAELSNLEIPSFLKQGPAMAEGVGAPALPPPRPRPNMTTMRESEQAVPEMQPGSFDEVGACILAIEKAMELRP